MVPVRAFLKSETHWHFKQTGDISVANSALFSFYYKAPFRDFTKIVLIFPGDVSPHLYIESQLSLKLTDGDAYEF